MFKLKKIFCSPKLPICIVAILLMSMFSVSVFAQNLGAKDVYNGNVSTDTPSAPQSYHFTKNVGITGKNVLGMTLFTVKRAADWNIANNNSKINSSVLSASSTTGFLTPWKISAAKAKQYYNKDVEHSWAAGDVASCAINCKAAVNFGASASGSGASFNASVSFEVSATLGQYFCCATVADIQKQNGTGATAAKTSYLYMRMQA